MVSGPSLLPEPSTGPGGWSHRWQLINDCSLSCNLVVMAGVPEFLVACSCVLLGKSISPGSKDRSFITRPRCSVPGPRPLCSALPAHFRIRHPVLVSRITHTRDCIHLPMHVTTRTLDQERLVGRNGITVTSRGWAHLRGRNGSIRGLKEPKVG